MANEVRIRVVAAADDSLRSVLRPFEEAVARTQQKAGGAARQATEQTTRSLRTRVAAEERNAQYLERIRYRSMMSEQRMQERADRDRVRAAERVQTQLKTVGEREARERDSLAKRAASEFGSRAVSNIKQGATTAVRGAEKLANSAGYKLSATDSMGRNIELQRRATDLSNQGYIPSLGKERIDPREVEKQIKSAADSTGTDRLGAAEGLAAFVGKTGELQLGLDLLPKLGKLAKASGSDLSDLADAAGDVSSSLGDMAPDKKAGKVDAVMRMLAGQGKIGAVEMKHLSTQAAKIGTASTAFGGDPEKNIAFMGALTQMSRATGGSASATQAATSVSSFVNTLKTPARVKQFEAQGIEVYNKKTGIMNDPEQIILKALSKTKADPVAFKKMFANVQGARAVEGAANIYRRNRASALEGGASEKDADIAGLTAVKKEFDRFREITMKGKELEDSFQARMGNQDSKSAQFNAKFDDIIERMGDRLLPAFEKLEPVVLKATEGFASMVAWAAENPGKAIASAIAYSIGKAGIETVVKTGFEALLTNALGAGKTPTAGGAPGAGMGNLGAGLAIFGASIAITGAGITIMDAVFDKKGEAEGNANAGLAGIGNLLSEAGAQSTLTDQQKLEKAQEAKRRAQAIIDSGADAKYRGIDTNVLLGPVGGLFKEDLLSAALSSATAGTYGESWDKQNMDTANASKQEEAKAALAEANAKIDALSTKLGSTLNVTVTNMPTTGFGVDPKGRE